MDGRGGMTAVTTNSIHLDLVHRMHWQISWYHIYLETTGRIDYTPRFSINSDYNQSPQLPILALLLVVNSRPSRYLENSISEDQVDKEPYYSSTSLFKTNTASTSQQKSQVRNSWYPCRYNPPSSFLSPSRVPSFHHHDLKPFPNPSPWSIHFRYVSQWSHQFMSSPSRNLISQQRPQTKIKLSS